MGKRISVFLAMLVVIALLITVAFTGVDLMFVEIPSVQEGIIPGLDLSGGSIITYEAQAETVTKSEMNSVSAMLRQRLTALGYTEATLYEAGNKRIRVEIPNLSSEEAVRQIGSTAQLEFRDFEGTVWLTGDMVESAKQSYGPTDDTGVSRHHVVLTFMPEYRDLWAEATMYAAQNSADSNNYIAIYMDNEEVFAPFVDSKYASTGLTGDSCIVTLGGENPSQATKEFASFIEIGKLPFELKQVQLSNVGPTLGATALRTSLTAGAIGLGLVILFLLVYYRLPGLMSAIALLLYVALIAVTLAIMRINLSLPGIAGIILSIGMACDANIVIFERIKEELRSGKTVRGSVESGFKRARVAVIDSNITTIIAGVVLLSFGTGAIKGFATTLLVGVILSMFTALFVTQMLLNQMTGLGVVKLWYYGVREDRAESRILRSQFSFIKNFKWLGLPSALICLFAAVCLLLLPFGVSLFNFDIDFTGGTSFQLDIGKEVTNADMDNAAAIIRSVTGMQPSAPQKVGSTQIIVKIPVNDDDLETKSRMRDDVASALKADYADLELSTEDVGSSVGADLRRSAILSVIVAMILILFYITVRFQFSSGLASVTALLHDILILLAAYAIFQIPINMTFIAVLLTILGYSINSTIIVFDRIRENRKRMQKTSFAAIIDRSVKQTINRNINTTLTTLLPVVCIIIIGVPSVRNFALPIAIGLLAGAYSSIILSGAVWHSISGTDDKAAQKLESKTK